jgi:molybdopterin molybdotransferase
MVELSERAQRIARLMPLSDAMVCIDRLVAPVAPRRIETAAALGRTLAADVTAPRARPATALALRDGIAVRADATLDASSYAPVTLGGPPAVLEIGDPIPAGADAVASPDTVEMRGGLAHALAPLAPGDGVLPAGADAAAGEALWSAGRRLRDTDAAGLAVLGIERVEVREPRVLLVSARSGPDIVIDAIIGLLARVVAQAGAIVIAASLDSLGVDAPGDAVMVVGGSGVGARDRTVRELGRKGSVVFHGIGLAPGETAAFGMIGPRPVLVVPGRLDAALAVWMTLGRRMLARLCGHEIHDPVTPVVLTRKIASTLGLVELVPVARQAGGVAPLAAGYLSLQSLAHADGLVLVPADSEGFPAGAAVEMRPLP